MNISSAVLRTFTRSCGLPRTECLRMAPGSLKRSKKPKFSNSTRSAFRSQALAARHARRWSQSRPGMYASSDRVTANRTRQGPSISILLWWRCGEINPPDPKAAICWRLYTSQEVHTAEDASRIVALYKLRWRIEQVFRAVRRATVCVLKIVKSPKLPAHVQSAPLWRSPGPSVPCNWSMLATAARDRRPMSSMPASSRRSPNCRTSSKARRSVRKTPTRPRLSPGSPGSSHVLAAGIATTNLLGQKPCAMAGLTSLHSSADMPSPPSAKQMCESRSHKGEGKSPMRFFPAFLISNRAWFRAPTR